MHTYIHTCIHIYIYVCKYLYIYINKIKEVCGVFQSLQKFRGGYAEAWRESAGRIVLEGIGFNIDATEGEEVELLRQSSFQTRSRCILSQWSFI